MASVSIYDGKLHYITDPTEADKDFAGWYSNAALTAKIGDGATMPDGVTQLYAKWNNPGAKEITFYANG